MKVPELIIDAYGCKGNLDNDKILLRALVKAAKKVKAKVVSKYVYHYKPFGTTIIVLLAETHISLYTWPEFKFAAVEIFLCNEKMNPYYVWEAIKKVLSPQKVKIRKVVRNIE